MIELLHALPIFSALKKKEIQFLADIARGIEYPPNTILLHEGALGKCLYIIVEGRLEILKSLGTEGEYLVGVRGPGEYIGEMYLFNPEGVRTASVRSLTGVRLLEISTEDFQALLNRRPDLEYALACGITQRLLDTERKLLRTIADKDRKLAQALVESKFSGHEAPGRENFGPNQTTEEKTTRTGTGLGTFPDSGKDIRQFSGFPG